MVPIHVQGCNVLTQTLQPQVQREIFVSNIIWIIVVGFVAAGVSSRPVRIARTASF